MASLECLKMTRQIWAEGSSTQRHCERVGRLSSKAWVFSGGKCLQCETALSFPKAWDVEKGHTDTPSKSYSLTQKSLAPPESEINSQLCQRSCRCPENGTKVSALGTSPPAVSRAVTPQCVLGCPRKRLFILNAGQHSTMRHAHTEPRQGHKDLKAPRQ